MCIRLTGRHSLWSIVWTLVMPYHCFAVCLIHGLPGIAKSISSLFASLLCGVCQGLVVRGILSDSLCHRISLLFRPLFRFRSIRARPFCLIGGILLILLSLMNSSVPGTVSRTDTCLDILFLDFDLSVLIFHGSSPSSNFSLDRGLFLLLLLSLWVTFRRGFWTEIRTLVNQTE